MKYSIILAALLAVSLAACGKKESPPPAVEAPPPVVEAPPPVVEAPPPVVEAPPPASGVYVRQSWHSANTAMLADFGTDNPQYQASLQKDWEAHKKALTNQ